MLEHVDYNRRQHAVYAQGRSLPPAVVTGWMRLFAQYAEQRRPLTVLDLGSGTGRFSPALAETFGGPVYGVEPFARMRAVATETAAHPDVTYLDGSAENIPLPDDQCDLALLFLSLHHFRDRERAAAQIARVLRSDGRLLIRSSFADRLPDKVWHQYFPRARAIEAEMFPTLAEVTSLFARVGFHQVAFDHQVERYTANFPDYIARMRWMASSTFEHLTEDEIRQGFAAMEAAAPDMPAQSIEERSDLLVLARD